MPKERGWIVIAPQCGDKETQPCHTINRAHCYPPEDQRTLADFGSILGFENVEDHDPMGRNIFHHLFNGAKFCWLLAEIASKCFSEKSQKMPGNYRAAIRQPILNGPIQGDTPLHTLCKDSDACLLNLEIVRRCSSTIWPR